MNCVKYLCSGGVLADTSKHYWKPLPLQFLLIALSGVGLLEFVLAGTAPSESEFLLLRFLQVLWIILSSMAVGCFSKMDLKAIPVNTFKCFCMIGIACLLVFFLVLLLYPEALRLVTLPFPITWPFLLALLIVSPIAEEIIFRGLLYKLLRQANGVFVSVAVSSVLFALAHGLHPVAQLLGGVIFAFAYEWSRNIWIPIFLHVGANSMVLVIVLSMSKP